MNNVKLSDKSIFISDGNYSSKYPRAGEMLSSGIPFITPGNFNGDEISKEKMNYISSEKHAFLKKGHVHENDVLITVRGNNGVVMMVPKEFNDANINAQLAFIRSDGTRLLPKYIFYYFRSPAAREYVKKNETGTALKQFPINKLLNFEIPELPICIQKDLIEQFDNINNQIKELRKYKNSLDELVKSRFIEMFNKEQNTEKLVNLCKFINGDRGKNYPSANDRIETGIPFINAGHLNNNLVCFDDMDYISEAKYESLSSGKVQQNDIIYCLRGSLGKKGIVTFDKGAIASSLLILRANNKIRPLFLLYSLEQEYVLSQMEMSNNGSSQPNLSAQSVKQFNILLPSLNKQIEFEKFVELIDKSKFNVQKHIDLLTELFNKKMDEYFGGDK